MSQVGPTLEQRMTALQEQKLALEMDICKLDGALELLADIQKQIIANREAAAMLIRAREDSTPSLPVKKQRKSKASKPKKGKE